MHLPRRHLLPPRRRDREEGQLQQALLDPLDERVDALIRPLLVEARGRMAAEAAYNYLQAYIRSQRSEGGRGGGLP